MNLRPKVPMLWSRDYVGLPHARGGRSSAGADCYGLLWLIYRDVLGIDLASYAGETLDAVEKEEIADLIAGGCATSPWQQVAFGAERVFDMAVFRRGKLASHVAVVTAPGRMLHIVDVGESHVVSFTSGSWHNRLAGLYRHEALA
ncbi:MULTISPECIES: NlpC/P60 family protein [unclassified Bradyrhizobium]|uniref:NlpC/P60 family protein n=1 Tax=unclassified Bradyrhizobium TaxID=2631580 RepID=UPI001FF9C163|nr:MULTISPECIES: NlpC/P60 family protein [unclassified Bradyrhizobium]